MNRTQRARRPGCRCRSAVALRDCRTIRTSRNTYPLGVPSRTSIQGERQKMTFAQMLTMLACYSRRGVCGRSHASSAWVHGGCGEAPGNSPTQWEIPRCQHQRSLTARGAQLALVTLAQWHSLELLLLGGQVHDRRCRAQRNDRSFTFLGESPCNRVGTDTRYRCGLFEPQACRGRVAICGCQRDFDRLG